MTQNSYETQPKLYNKLDKNMRSSITHHPLNHAKHSSSGLNIEPEFLFFRPLVAAKHNITHASSHLTLEQTQQCSETVSKELLRLPRIKRKSSVSTEFKVENFIPHEIGLHLQKSGSSSSQSSGSTSSLCEEYLLPMIYQNLESDIEKKQKIMESSWGRGTALDISLWEDDNAPVIKIKDQDDIERDNTEFPDVLTDEIVGACSSFLSKSPEIGLYVKNKCELMKMDLRDISVLFYHRYLQYIDLTNNNISDLTPLGGIPYLMYLNAAQNKLRDVLRFKPAWYLTYVNLMGNQISKIDDLSEFWSIVRLDLSHNEIESIQGLKNLRHLRFLNLGYNLIECIENLDNLNIQELNLEYNCITDFKSDTPKFGISTLPNLHTLILRHNKLSVLGFFEGAYSLRYIDLRSNRIVDLLEVSHLRSLVYEVDFRGNPCTKWSSYRDVVLFSMPSIMVLDGADVTVSEKVSASTIFAPSIELTAARSVTKLMLLEYLNPPNIGMHVTPVDQSTPPLIILSGPPAVKKSILARQIADSLPDRVRYCASHTTKPSANNNRGRLSYHFINREEFNEMTRRGEFLSTEELLGNSYGFHVSEIAALALEKKVGITHMDWHAALQMQGRYVNAKLILVLTRSVEIHRQWIQEKFKVYTWVKSSSQNLVTIQVGKPHQPVVEIEESISSKFDFIGEILNEVMDSLELQLLRRNMTSQESQAISTSLTIESPTMLPTITKIESEVEIEKKHISFRADEKECIYKAPPRVNVSSEKLAAASYGGLKIIMDEHSNVIIEDKEEKRERIKAKILMHHNSLHAQMNNGEFIEDEEYGESVSSEDLSDSKPDASGLDSPRVLEQHYSKLVIESRELYLQRHRDNPGYFSLVVFTDDFMSAYNQVVNFIYEFYINQPKRKQMFSMETERLLKAVVPSKTEIFLGELRENLSTSKKQMSTNLRSYGLTSWSEALPSQLSQIATEIVNSTKERLTKSS